MAFKKLEGLDGPAALTWDSWITTTPFLDTQGKLEVQQSMCGTLITTLVNGYISHGSQLFMYQIWVKC